MSRKKFNQEFKSNAVSYRLKNMHKRIEEICGDLGVSESALSRWLSDYRKSNTQGKAKLSEEQQELKRLKQENQDLKEINEILKKAHKYFVSQSL